MCLLLSFILAVASCQVASARLGETEAECLQRYGPAKTDPYLRVRARASPLLKGAPERTWEYQGWSIRAAFDTTGRAVRITYLKLSQPGRSPSIQDFELRSILDANGGASSWERYQENTGLNLTKALTQQLTTTMMGPTYRRKTDGATMQCARGSMQVTLSLPAAAAWDQRQKSAREAQARANASKF